MATVVIFADRRPLEILARWVQRLSSGLIFWVLAAALPCHAAEEPIQASEQMISVTVGGTESLQLSKSAERINIDPKGIINATMPDPHTLVIEGQQAGYAVMVIQYLDGTLDRWVLQVHPPADSFGNLADELRKQLGAVDGLNVSSNGMQILLTGAIDEAGKLTIKPFVQMLSGVLRDETTLRRPEPVIPKVVQTQPVTPPPHDFSNEIVQIDVEIIQVQKIHADSLGVQWFPNGGWGLSAEGTAQYTASMGTGTGNTEGFFEGGFVDVISGNGSNAFIEGSVSLSNVEWILEALVRKGYAKVLATPKLTVQSGRVGQFLVGGELPIVQTNALSSTVEYKKYGTQLEILPTVTGPDTIYIEVKASVSDVDNTQRVQGVPGIRTREASTIVTVQAGRMFALAGLISTESFEVDTSVPGLSKLPVMGGLFRSSRTEQTDYETILLMVPHILRDGNRTTPPEARIAPGPMVQPILNPEPPTVPDNPNPVPQPADAALQPAPPPMDHSQIQSIQPAAPIPTPIASPTASPSPSEAESLTNTRRRPHGRPTRPNRP